MASLEDFDRQVKALVAKSKLSSSAVQSLVHLAMTNIASDAHLVSTLFRQHKKAASSSKLTSLYLIDAIAREARSRLKKQVAKGKEPAVVPLDAAASTTPLYSPPPDGAGEGAGTYASFLKKLEAVLGKVVLDCWENGPPEHKEKVRKVLDIWTKAATFSSSVLVRISQKLLASTSSSSTTASPSTRGGGMSPVAPAMSPSGPSISPVPREMCTSHDLGDEGACWSAASKRDRRPTTLALHDLDETTVG
ncbi:SPOSA6832_05035 [Sporobolomyces salmonicolor]|uniref:SPOSA6832_05035-mRNA-1:cds n=1 Tax=Sporidiobolus salmonicolor TaxID=5005 RepID=A0A0D6ETL2_SPOSA|nr:SPOSA6832_05035 [Sporobolomyces salmonicolor]